MNRINDVHARDRYVPLVPRLTNGALQYAIHMFTLEHGRMPRQLCGSYRALAPAAELTRYAESGPWGGEVHTHCGIIDLKLDPSCGCWYLK